MGLIDKLGVLTREKCRFTLRIKYGHQNISIKYFYDLSIISRT